MAGFGEQKEKKKKKPHQKPPMNGESLLKKAINYHMQGELIYAEKAYRAAIDSGLLNAALFSNLGIICQTSQRTEEAISLYKKAIQINPYHPDAYTNLGGLYKDLGNFDQALATTLKSLELKPDNPDALINLGGIYMGLGNLDQAVASTLKSLELKPDNPVALTNLFNSYGEGDLPVLKSTARRALEHNQEILNDLTYIEALSSLGKDFAKNIIPTTASINQSVNFRST